MKKLLSIIAAAAIIAALSGCTENVSETVSTVGETSLQSAGEAPETNEASDTEKSSETEEYAEEAVDEVEDDIAEDDEEAYAEPVDEPVEEPVDYAKLMQGLPTNAKLYDMDSDNIPDMPEFTLSTDGLSEYDSRDVSRARLRIKSILECAVSGEVPAYKSSGYVWQSPQQLAGIRLNGWEIADEKLVTDGNIRYEVTVTMDVAESSSEFVTEGRGDYLMIYCPDEDSSFLPLRKVGELDESRLLPSYGDPKAYVDLCTYYTAYFRNFFSGDTIDDLSAPNAANSVESAVFCAYVAARRAGGFSDTDNGIIPYDEFNETLEKILGFSADAIGAKNNLYYNPDEDTIEIPGRGTSWICGWLAEDTDGDEDGTRVVTIDYYEDDFYLVKSRTVRYTVRNNNDGTCSMLKIERLFTSDRGILAGTV
ncbi:MAG: hypothetical protein K2N60_11910 [Oscillospiraceae bacterium]|nr:hypothetical protein [Oscillospiraceae bacterium]